MKLRHLVLACVPLLGTGCAQIQLIRDDVARVDRKVDSARSETRAIQKDRTRDSSAQQLAKELAVLRADLTLQLKQMSTDIQKAQSRIEGIDQRLARLDQEIGILRGTRKPGGGTDTSKSQSMSILEQTIKTASDDFQRGRYDLAYRGFQDVLSRDSSGVFSARAVYQMGECRYAQGNWDEARLLFQRVVRDWPNADQQVCASWFKMGLASEKLRQIPDRDSAWAKLQNRCPGTNEAQRARDLLNR